MTDENSGARVEAQSQSRKYVHNRIRCLLQSPYLIDPPIVANAYIHS